MPKYRVGLLSRQGADIVIVQLEDAFQHKSADEQYRAVAELQVRANAAGLNGIVVPVWNNAGQIAFIAPPKFHGFLQGIDIEFVTVNFNRELCW